MLKLKKCANKKIKNSNRKIFFFVVNRNKGWKEKMKIVESFLKKQILKTLEKQKERRLNQYKIDDWTSKEVKIILEEQSDNKDAKNTKNAVNEDVTENKENKTV